MKVLGISGSARKDGNTSLIMNIVFQELNKAGIETELVQLSGNIIETCRGCFACKGQGNCVFKMIYLLKYLIKWYKLMEYY